MIISLGGLKGDLMFTRLHEPVSPKVRLAMSVDSQFGHRALPHEYQTRDNPFPLLSHAVNDTTAAILQHRALYNDKGPVILSGSSVGGGIALNVAPQLAAQDIETHLVLFGTVYDIPLAAEHLMIRDGGGVDAPQMLRDWRRGPIDLKVSGTAAGVFPFTTPHAHAVNCLYSFASPTAKLNGQAWVAAMGNKLGSIQILAGEKDELAPRQLGNMLLASAPCPDDRKRYIQFPGGHNDANAGETLQRLELLHGALLTAAVAAYVPTTRPDFDPIEITPSHARA